MLACMPQDDYFCAANVFRYLDKSRNYLAKMLRIRDRRGAFRSWCVVFTVLLMQPNVVAAQRRMRVVSWNVENLFDCQHDTLKKDVDFLPDGAYHWTRSKYWRKLDDVAKTLAAVGGDEGLPVLVGLCEVENDSVMRDLTRRSAMRAADYEYVMTQSEDARGVDVALLYQPFLFRLLGWRSVRIPSVEHGFQPTRDVLYAKGLLLSGDTLHLAVCHLPSKAGKGRSSGRHRELAVSTLRSVVDSVLTADASAKMLVMGDFNAVPGESVFDALLPPLRETLPTSRRELRKPIGTYYYKRQWSYLDHILVSEGFARWQPQARASESRQPWLLTEEGTPRRTFRGPVYQGGVSDHLPLYLDIVVP